MTTNKRVTGRAVSLPVGISFGVILSSTLTLGLAVLETWLVLTGRVEESMTGYMSMGVLALSSFLGGMLSASKTKRRRMLVCLISGTVYSCLLLMSTALFFGGSYQGTLTGVIVIMVASSISGLIGLRGERRGSKKYRRYHSC